MSCSCSKCNPPCCEEETCEEPAVVIASALEVTNSWNVPACDESAVLYIPALTTALIGSYISNPTYGTFRVSGINSTGGKLTVVNDCLPGNAAPGTVVPAGTTFVFGPPPTLTDYIDYIPAVTALAAMTVTLDDTVLARYFTVDQTVGFEVQVKLTVGGVPTTTLYVSLPVNPDGLAGSDAACNFLCYLVNNAVQEVGTWRPVNANQIIVQRLAGGNFTAGAVNISVQGFYKKAS